MARSEHELQEVQNEPATCTSGFASKDSDHRFYDQTMYKKCMTGYITVK